MSENGEHRDSERADKGSKWVWWSTEESVERGAISVLACAEVAAGIWLYWWFIPWWLETNLHLLISVLVAPLLLLRSPASVVAALAAFDRYSNRDEDLPLRSTRGAVAMLLAAGLSALASWGLVETWLSGHDGWSLFWRAGIMGWISLVIGWAVAIAVAGVGAVAGTGPGPLVVANVAAAAAAAVAVAVAGVVTGVVAVAGVLVIAIAAAVAVSREFVTVPAAAATAAAAAVVAGITGIAPGLPLGHWLRSVIIKIGSTIRHLAEGWGRLSVNWRSLVWAHDFRRPPELLPGIERHPTLRALRIGRLLSGYKSESIVDRVVATFLVALSIPIFFLPAWLYRLSLKSTCWFWWPLVFSQTSGRTAAREVAKDGTPGADVVFEEQTKPLWAKLQFGLALALLVAAFGVPQDLLVLLPVSRGGIDLVGMLGDMIYLMLPCAGVQIALFLLCGRYLARARAGHLDSWPRTAFLWLFNLRQLLLGSALVAALVLLLENWVPGFSPFADFVETHYFSWFPLLRWT